jgi:uncharacterized protein YciI
VKFAAYIEYAPDPAKIKEWRPKHRGYLTDLFNDGKLAASGPFTDDSGALIVYEAPTKEAAEAILKGDPFFKQGVFAKWELRPWNAIFVNRDLLGG